MKESPSSQPQPEDDGIDLKELWSRIKRGLPLLAGLACLGLAIGAGAYAISAQLSPLATTTRVLFRFSGFEKNEYPDKSKFSADDLRSPEIVAEALRRKGLDATEEVQSKVRAALSIEGLIPDNIVKERDRLRASGQAQRTYVPDEYTVTLTLPRKFPLSPRQRELLISEIVSVYQEKFSRTYVVLPLDFGKAFEALNGADYFDYELILKQESQNISTFLMLLAGVSPRSGEQDLALQAGASRNFRSPRSNLSFSDLLKQSQLFTQIHLNETLGLIRQNGLSKDRQLALMKMDYYLKTLGDEENMAMEEEKVVLSLLKQTQERMQNYVLGVKSQVGQQQAGAPLVDQGLVDSLLANDANNFLVRKALDASLRTRRIQAEKAVLLDQRNNMQAFIKSDADQKTEALAQFHKSLDQLKVVYDRLIGDIRVTYEDFQRQQYGDAVRVSMQTRTESLYRGLAMAGIAGFGIGGALGLGLAMLGVAGRRTAASHELK